MGIFSIILFLLAFNVWGEQEKEKAWTMEEFKKALDEEVGKKLGRLTGDNAISFSRELLKREKEMKIEELELKKQREQLMMDRKELSKKLAIFLKSQNKIIGCMDGAEEAKGKRIGHMVDVISNMRPKAAAGVLAVQDVNISVKILELLPAAKVSKIFNLMDKEISARLQKQYMTMKK